MTPNNINGGFRGSGLWVTDIRGPDQSRIKPSAYTTSLDTGFLAAAGEMTRSSNALEESEDVPSVRVKTAKQIYRLFRSNASELLSDKTVKENGIVGVSTKSGAIPTSEKVLSASKKVVRRGAAENLKKLEAAATREKRRVEKSVLQENQSERATEREEASLQNLITKRASGRARAAATYRDQREIARNRHTSRI